MFHAIYAGRRVEQINRVSTFFERRDLMSTTNQSTKDLKRVLTRNNLMGIAVGQIIGAGVMVMSISALGMTGRSVNIAFVIAAIFTVIAAIPIIFYSSVLRMRGGLYTQAAVFIGNTFSGVYIVQYIFSNMSIAMYAIGLTSYIVSLLPAAASYQMWINFGIMTVFFVLNFFGVEWMAKIQDIMFYVLIAALLVFTAFGLPKVHWSGYFGNELFGRPLIENGLMGLFQASAFLTFATGGATVIVNMSAEAINPQKDIPFVTITSTVGVALLYALMASVIGGVLPPDEVLAAGNLAPIAMAILPRPLYYFFVIGGACFALGTTLNATIGWVTKPIMQACEDGWFPRVLATLHPKYKSPMYLLLIFYIINLLPIFFGLDVSTIGNWVLLLQNIVNVVMVLGVLRLPKLFPEQWEKSPFHVNNGVFNVLLIFGAAVAAFQAYLNSTGLSTTIVLLNFGILIIAALYAVLMMKTGKVQMTVSYDLD